MAEVSTALHAVKAGELVDVLITEGDALAAIAAHEQDRARVNLARWSALLNAARAEAVPIIQDGVYAHRVLQRVLYEELPALLQIVERLAYPPQVVRG